MKRVLWASGFLLPFALLPPAFNGTWSAEIPRRIDHEDLVDSLKTDLADYSWPTDASRTITSSFGEFRRTHFHGGIDISTHDRTGYRVFASRDGYVERIRIGPTGYGKILYVRHRDGYSTTYAHLKSFAGAIEARAVREQERLQQYPIELQCGPDELRVRKGETIAYTGESGTGSPHLHFEVRDENMNPVNPLLCPGLRIEDTIAPEILRVAFSPLSPDAEVNAMRETATFSVTHAGRQLSRIPGRISLSGRVGVSVDVRDRSNGSRYRHGVYGHDLYLDDRLLYSVRINKVLVSEDQASGLYYDWDMDEERNERFARLYLPFPVKLPLVHGSFHDAGVLTDSLPQGDHTLKIVSLDFNGNSTQINASVTISPRPILLLDRDSLGISALPGTSDDCERVIVSAKYAANAEWHTRSFPVSPGQWGQHWPIPELVDRTEILRIVAENRWGFRSPPVFLILRNPSAPPAEMTLRDEYKTAFVRLDIGTKGIFNAPPTIALYEGENRRTLPAEAVDLQHYSSAFVPDPSIQGLRRIIVLAQINGHDAEARSEFDLYPIVPGTHGSFAADSGNVRISYDSGSVLSTTIIRIDKEHDEDGTVYSLEPGRWVLKGSMIVSLRNTSGSPNAGLFFRGRSGWRLLTPLTPTAPGYLTSRIHGTLGDVAVWTDTTPPSITTWNIRRTNTRHPIISFRFHDDLAGIEYESLKMYIDGIGVIPEIDGVHHRASFEAARPLERGSHHVTIRLNDLLGNTTTAEHRFVLR